MGWVDGKVALITGGASGLGRAIAKRFIDEGARVGVLDRSATGCASVGAELGGNAAVTEGDVTSRADNRRAVADTVARSGRLYSCIGHPGILGHPRPLVL